MSQQWRDRSIRLIHRGIMIEVPYLLFAGVGNMKQGEINGLVPLPSSFPSKKTFYNSKRNFLAVYADQLETWDNESRLQLYFNAINSYSSDHSFPMDVSKKRFLFRCCSED